MSSNRKNSLTSNSSNEDANEPLLQEPPSPERRTRQEHTEERADAEAVNARQNAPTPGGGPGGGPDAGRMTRAQYEQMRAQQAAAAQHAGLLRNDSLRGQRRLTREEYEREEKLRELKYGADAILSLIMPVSVTLIIVISTIKSVAFFTTHDTQLPYTPMTESSDSSAAENFGNALINVAIVIAIVVCMTMFLVMLYKYSCYRVIHGWLIVVSMMLLFIISYLYVDQVLDAHNLAFDWVSMGLLIWNFGVGGMLAIHWKGPLRLQQIYNVFISSLIALLLIKNLPNITAWVLLAAISVYDLIAVLCPGGPLKQLLETAQEREEQLFPALIYSSAMAWPLALMADVGTPPSAENSTAQSEPVAQPAATQRAVDTSPVENLDEEEEDTGGVKLGLGDFIFYSVLVGLAAQDGDWSTIFACYIGIVWGLTCTLFILSVFQKALPALPISVFFGIIFYFSTSLLITPCMDVLALKSVFI